MKKRRKSGKTQSPAVNVLASIKLLLDEKANRITHTLFLMRLLTAKPVTMCACAHGWIADTTQRHVTIGTLTEVVLAL